MTWDGLFLPGQPVLWNPEPRTPNPERLAAEGVRFTNGYAASPVCSPTRASIMSGKYPACVGVTNYIGGDENCRHCQPGGESGKLLSAPYVPFSPTRETSLATALKRHGYATWHLGKWHLGSERYWPDQHGFDRNVGGCHMGHPSGRGYCTPSNLGRCAVTERRG